MGGKIYASVKEYAIELTQQTGDCLLPGEILVSPDQNLYEYRRKRDEVFFKPVAYSASKSGILNLTRYLAVYWAKKNVRVNSLTIAGVFNNQEQDFLDVYCGRIPVGRMANADEYNGSVLFLASPASHYMTGANLVIDGGWTAI